MQRMEIPAVQQQAKPRKKKADDSDADSASINRKLYGLLTVLWFAVSLFFILSVVSVGFHKMAILTRAVLLIM